MLLYARLSISVAHKSREEKNVEVLLSSRFASDFGIPSAIGDQSRKCLVSWRHMHIKRLGECATYYNYMPY